MRAVTRRLVGTHNDFPSTARANADANITANFRRVCIANETIRNPSAVYVGFSISDDAETDMPNAVNYHTAIEYPAGVVREFTTNNRQSRTLTVPAGSIWSETDKIRGLTIPKGAQFRIVGHVSVGAGERFYSSEQIGDADSGATISVGAALSDLTLAPLSIPQSGATNIIQPVGLMADALPESRGFSLQHDSIGIGSGGVVSTMAARGYMAVFCEPRFDYTHFGRIGLQAGILKGVMTRRLAFMARAGFTDVWLEPGINDLTAAGNSAAVLTADLAEIIALIRAACPTVERFWQSTITPRVAVDGVTAADDNQTVNGNLADGRRQTFNTTVRALGIPGQTGFVEVADAVENALDDDWWVAGATDDGTHPVPAGGALIQTQLIADDALAL